MCYRVTLVCLPSLVTRNRERPFFSSLGKQNRRCPAVTSEPFRDKFHRFLPPFSDGKRRRRRESARTHARCSIENKQRLFPVLGSNTRTGSRTNKAEERASINVNKWKPSIKIKRKKKNRCKRKKQRSDGRKRV